MGTMLERRDVITMTAHVSQRGARQRSTSSKIVVKDVAKCKQTHEKCDKISVSPQFSHCTLAQKWEKVLKTRYNRTSLAVFPSLSQCELAGKRQNYPILCVLLAKVVFAPWATNTLLLDYCLSKCTQNLQRRAITFILANKSSLYFSTDFAFAFLLRDASIYPVSCY